MNFEELEQKAKKLISEGWTATKLLSLIETKQGIGEISGPKVVEGRILVSIIKKEEDKVAEKDEEELFTFDGTLKGLV